MPSHSPTRLPKTTTASAPSSASTPARCPRRLGAADERREEEAARHPGGGDPEDRELQVPGAQQVVGEPAREVEAVEGARLDAVVGERAAGERLEQEQQRDDREVEADRPLARRERPARERAVVRVSARRARRASRGSRTAEDEEDDARGRRAA